MCQNFMHESKFTKTLVSTTFDLILDIIDKAPQRVLCDHSIENITICALSLIEFLS